MKQAFITVDLGFGDAGKGATIDWLCREHKIDLVVRYSGGAQAGHNVELETGERHTFSQFGAGFFTGAKTFLGPAVIIKPVGIRNEAVALHKITNRNPFETLRVHPDCLVATPYHQAMNRIKEESRSKRHGSCGIGIGETRKYWLEYGEDAVFASDLRDRKILKKKLALIRQRFWSEIQSSKISYISSENNFYQFGEADVAQLLFFYGEGIDVSPQLQEHNSVAYEAAQGVLIDETFGFHPNTTWSTVTTHHAEDMLDSSQYEKVTRLGITRAYTTRHGEGPLPTFCQNLTDHAIDHGNPENPWQGKIRMGWLDMTLLKYGMANCGSALDGLVVNHLDHIQENPHYSSEYLQNEFIPSSTPTLVNQESLNRILDRAVPRMESCDPGQLLNMISKLAPIYAVSGGPTAKDRYRFECWK